MPNEFDAAQSAIDAEAANEKSLALRMSTVEKLVTDVSQRVTDISQRLAKTEKQTMLNTVAIAGLPNSSGPPVIPVPPPIGGTYSVTSPHTTHESGQWTDFSYGLPQSDFDFRASTNDQIMNTQPQNNTRWTINSSLRGGFYCTLITSVVTPVGGGPAASGSQLSGAQSNTAYGGSWTVAEGPAHDWAVANGMNEEDLFLHYADGQGKQHPIGGAPGAFYRNVSSLVGNNANGTTTFVVTNHGYADGARIEYLHGTTLPLPVGVPDGNYIISVVDVNTFTIPVELTNTPGAKGKVNNLLGNGTKTRANRKIRCSEFDTVSSPSGTFLNSWRWVTNPGGTGAQAFHTFRFSPIFARGNLIFIDECGTGSWNDNSGTGEWVGLSMEYNSRGMTIPQEQVVINRYLTDMGGVFTAARAANANKPFQINSGAYFFPGDVTMATYAGSCQAETSLTTCTFAPVGAWTHFTNCLNAGVEVIAVDSKFWRLDHTPSSSMNPHNYTPYTAITSYTGNGAPFAQNPPPNSIGMNRQKVLTYVSYLMAMGNDPQKYRLDQSGGEWVETPQSAKYLLLRKNARIGHPLAARQSISVIPDSGPMFRPSPNQATQVNDPLYWRLFDNGLIVCRYQGGSSSDAANQCGDATTYTWTLPTDRVYYFVNDQGVKNAAPSLTFQLNRSEAAVFVVT